MRGTNLALDCADGQALVPVDEAFAAIAGAAVAVAGDDRLPVAAAAGRVVTKDVRTAMPLPPFDHSAVDGYGLNAADLERPPPHRLRLVGRIAAGGPLAAAEVGPGEALRLFTGAPVPASVAAVVMEERCRAEPGQVVLSVPVADGANIRRKGEDVAPGSTIVEGGSLLDARHVAILAAAGVAEVAVRRRVKVALLSTGDELKSPGAPLEPGTIYDSNRPMLEALLARPWIDLAASRTVEDREDSLAMTWKQLAGEVDVILSSGGAAGSDTDHMARAIAGAGGMATPFRLALRPGKPIVLGRIGAAAVLGLPGNPVAAMVNFLLFGRALCIGRAGVIARRPRGQPAIAAAPIAHARGRTELAPARIVDLDDDGRPQVERLGRGGSARLRPLVLADGFVEIASEAGDLGPGDPVAFHPFHGALSP
jgi:molybdopterin molybdotransferase